MSVNIAENKKEERNKVSFCLIIPMFNEENNVIQCVDTFCEFLDKLDNKCELVGVDDGSTDNTPYELEKLKKFHKNLKVETHEENRGYGVANRTGASYALSFGYKYSKPMNAFVSDAKGNNIPVYMGSYGIGISRLVGATIEANYNNEIIIRMKS